MKASSVSCDLEPGLLHEVKTNFAGCSLILCYFHVKQRWRKKLKEECHFPTSVITKFLGVDGIINILTIIPISEIATKGIAYVRSKMEETEANTPIWDIFWVYFKKNYLKGSWGPDYWSIHRFLKSEDSNYVFINRFFYS